MCKVLRTCSVEGHCSW